MKTNQAALDRYHFVEANSDDLKRTPLQELYRFSFSSDSPTYIADRVKNPSSPQLARLLAASTTAKTDPNATCNSSAQLYGEYLHAFEDTFAHRNQDNDLYTPETFGYGTGHAADGENPDYTYNHFSGIPGIGWWNTNEARTLEMETEVFAKLKGFGNAKGSQTSLSAITTILNDFNSFHASEHDNPEGNGLLAEKIAILNKGLMAFGYKGIDMTYSAYNNSKSYGYSIDIAAENRVNALTNLQPTDYVGTILPNGTAPLPPSKPKK